MEPYRLTKFDLQAIRRSSGLAVHLYEDRRAPLVRWLFDDLGGRNRSEYQIPIPVTIAGRVKHDGCFALVNLYPRQSCETTSIIQLLREGDAIALEFAPDYHGTGYTAAASLHVDVLMLYIIRQVRGNRVGLKFTLDSSTTPENSARMCKGVGYSEFLQRCANDAAPLMPRPATLALTA